jgi:hypothetical protein
MLNRIEWDRSVRVASLNFTNSTNHDSALNCDLPIVPVEVIPLQTNELARPEAPTHCDYARRAEQLHHKLQDLVELFRCQNDWLPQPLR